MNETTALQQVWLTLWALRLLITIVGFAVFIYAMRTDERVPTTVRRLIAASLFSLLLAGPFIAIAHADDEDEVVIITKKCEELTIWDLEYWIYECYLYGR